jgi:DNA-binding SARP family transcriptional activator/tetratricopeptide (TPR) repeat protein
MEFGLLGTLEIRGHDGSLPSGRRKERALLALLLLEANRVVPRDRLINELWRDDPPERAVKRLQVHVSQLRKLLPALTLRTRSSGYVLEVDPDAIDVSRFERLSEAARGADPQRASSLLHEALGLWRGPALVEFDEAFARVAAARLEELRLVALEEQFDADLALGHDAGLVADLERLVAEHPHRERLRGQLMHALYRAGRQTDALAAYRDGRAALDELGLEPGAPLRQLERRILAHDASLERPRVALPGPLVPTAAFPFVGRAGELTALRAGLERAERGEGGLVLLAAEAGGGKTRLVRELAVEAAARGVLVLYGASDAAVTTPYQPLREWLEFLARALEPGALDAALGDRRDLVARLVPELARLPTAPADRDELDRYALQSAVCEVLRRVSRAQPVVFVAEDIHWADAETLQLVRRLAATAPEARMLLVATYRDRGEELGQAFSETLAGLMRLDSVRRISPARLTSGEVGDFITGVTDAEAPGELAEAIAELTGGTPLLLCELWRDLRERGAVEVSDAGVAISQPLAELRGPGRLGDIVRHRLSRLSPETAEALELAAVSGPVFELRVLAHAAGRERSAVAVEEATAHGLLEGLPGTVPACRFAHELIRRVIYDRITGVRRAELHLSVGEALEQAYRADPARVLPELAHHFTLAAAVAGTERAVDYNLRAGAAAIATAAFEEAAASLSNALELGIDDPRERARVQVELGYLFHQLRRGSAAEASLAESLDAATGLEERGIAARALVQRSRRRLADPELDLDEMREVCEAAIETLGQVGDYGGRAIARRSLAIALSRQGRSAEAESVLERALVDAAGDQAIRREVIGTLVNVLCIGPTPVAEAIRRSNELLQTSRNDRVLEAVITRFLAYLSAMAGRFDESREQVRRSSSVLDEVSYLEPSWVYRTKAGHAKELTGDRAGAELEYLAAWQGFDELGDAQVDERAMQAAGYLANLYCDEGRWDDAARCLALGEDIALAGPTGTALLRLCARARVAAHQGELAEALTLARRAVETAEPSDGLNVKARTWLALAEVQGAAGLRSEADAAVAEAIRLFEAKGNVAAAALVRAAAT